MQFSIDQEIFLLYPDLNIAVVIIKDANNAEQLEEVGALLRHEEHVLREIARAVPVLEQENIRCWKEAYKQFGVGREYRSSIEALFRRIVKGGNVPRINTLVDVYNAASIKYLLPVGGEDLAKVKGDLRLVRAQGDEHFIALGQIENDPPITGEVMYRDDAQVLCRRFNWREADATKLTRDTTRAVLVVEALPPTSSIEVKEAASFLGSCIEKYCNAKAEHFLLNSQQPAIHFLP